MNIIIPMAGLGSRFVKYGFSTNKYLLPVDISGTKMIEKAILTLNVPECSQFIFILREENGEDRELRLYLSELCRIHSYGCVILSVDHITEGPACTAYLAKDFINNDIPLIISNSDQVLDWNFDMFMNDSIGFDGSVLTYTPPYDFVLGAVDKHSFVRFDENTGKPVEFVEKTAISRDALIGVHYYSKGSLFLKAAEYIFENNIRAPNGEFYLSYTYQALLYMGYSVGTHRLSLDEHFYPVGEPEDYFNYYNLTGQFFQTNIKNYNVLNSYDFFNISYGLKGKKIYLVSSLFIPFDEPTNIMVGGEYIFQKDMYYIEVFGIDESKSININEYVRGWLIGDFEPCIKKTTNYEIGVLRHKQGEKWDFHYHKDVREINILLSGEMVINNVSVKKDTIFIFEKGMISCPLFFTDCVVLCIKVPSVPGDKLII
jgi:dTDP-glucose pyrophosphorylase/mannose-6-phosphate isomerase-like protein (cupin superfamily)